MRLASQMILLISMKIGQWVDNSYFISFFLTSFISTKNTKHSYIKHTHTHTHPHTNQFLTTQYKFYYILTMGCSNGHIQTQFAFTGNLPAMDMF